MTLRLLVVISLSLTVVAGKANAVSINEKSEDPSSQNISSNRPNLKRSSEDNHNKTALTCAPGQLIVKFKTQGPEALNACAHCLLSNRQSFQSATLDGSSSLDDLNKKNGVKKISALFLERHGLSNAQAQQKAQTLYQRARRKLPQRPSQSNLPLVDLTHVYVLELDTPVSPIIAAIDFAKDPHVEFAEPNYLMKAHLLFNDPYYQSSNSWGQGYRDLWGLDMIRVETAWPLSKGQGVTVAVVDSGLDYNHEDIAANVWTNTDEIANNGLDDDANGYIDDIRGWDFVGSTAFNPQMDKDPMDGFGHGTHVSGTIAAVADNSKGVVGVAPEAKIMPLKALDDRGSGLTSLLSEAIVYAANNGASVINNSWGGTASQVPQVLQEAVAYADSLEVIVVASAGNKNNKVENGFYPAVLPQVISVGSVDHLQAKSDFSNFGQKLAVVAPGGDSEDLSTNRIYQNILSLRSANTDFIGDGKNIVGEKYYRIRGTSMAAPHASGLCALMLAINPTLSSVQLKEQLYGNTVDLNSLGFDTVSGFGLINAADTLMNGKDYILARISSPFSGFYFGQTLEMRGTATAKKFSRYELRVGKGQNPTSWQTTGLTFNGGGNVLEGVLGTCDLTQLEDGLWTLRLVVYDTTGKNAENRIAVTVDNSLHQGWPQSTLQGAPTFGAIDVADLDQDGKEEVIAGSLEGLLYAWRENGELMPGFPVVASNDFGSTLTPSAGNLDSDPELEIVVTSDGGPGPNLFVFNHDGTLVPGWPRTTANYLSNYVPSPPTLADMDRDGDLEIILGEDDGKIHAYHHTGKAVAGWPVLLDQEWFASGISVGDLDGDGEMEILAGNYDRMYAWHHKDFNADGKADRVDGWPIQVTRPLSGLYPVPSFLAPALGDIDGDGKLEVVAAAWEETVESTDFRVFAWKASGEVAAGWPQAASGLVELSSVALADMDKDGILDVVVNSNDNKVWAWQGDGTDIPGFPVTLADLELSYEKPAVIGDIEGDGYNEIFTQVGNSVVVLEHDGQIKPGWPKPINLEGAPAIADLDHDGTMEIIGQSSYPDNNIYVWDMKEPILNPELPWPMLGQNARHTGKRNASPQLAPIDAKVIQEGQSLQFTLSASDPDGDALTYTFSAIAGTPFPDGATLNSSTGQFSWTPTLDQGGDYDLLFTASDGSLSDTQGTTISVSDSAALVSIKASDANASEMGTGTDTGKFKVTRTPTSATALTVYYTIGTGSGMATNGTDYTALSGSVTIPANAAAATITVSPKNDALAEGRETVFVMLSSNATYTIVNPSSATVYLHDDEKPTVTIKATDSSAAEPTATLTNPGGFTLTRIPSTPSALTVFYTIATGTGQATNGVDYTSLSGSWIIPANTSSTTIPVTPLDDSQVEGTEKVKLTLSSNAAYFLGSPTSATVNIADND